MIRSPILVLLVSSIIAGADETDLFTASLPNVPDPTLVDGYARWNLGLDGIQGQPALPYSRLEFVMAPDADMGTISVVFLDTVSRVLPEDYLVHPVSKILPCACTVPETLPSSAARAVGVVPVGGDSVDYQTDAWFPSARSRFRTGALGQYKILDITYSAFVYNPVTLKLRKIESGRVRVDFQRNPDLAGAVFGRKERYEAQLRGNLANDTAVFALYGGGPTADAIPNPAGSGHFEMMLPSRGGEIQMPFARPENRYRVSVRGLDGKVRFAGPVQGNRIRIEGDPGLKLRLVDADRIE